MGRDSNVSENPKEGRERICISGNGHMVGLEGNIRGDRKKLLAMAGF